MEEKIKKPKYIYENIYNNLQIYVERMTEYYSNHRSECTSLFNSATQEFKNERNRFLPYVDGLESEINYRLGQIKKSYTNFSTLKGCVGTIEDTKQCDGIVMMAFYALTCNRLVKLYQNDKSYSKQIETYYKRKDNAISNILSTIFVLENTSDFYKDYFLYGNRKDENQNDTLTIDLPYIGTISLHYGSESKKNTIIANAKSRARTILINKYKKNQITKSKAEELYKKVDDNNIILPNYEGQLYELKSAFPIPFAYEYADIKREIERHSQKCGIYGVSPEDMTEEDVKRVINYKYLNTREKSYMLIKLGARKNTLLAFHKFVREKNMSLSKKLGKSCVDNNNIEEIENVGKHLNNQLSHQKDIGEIEND